MARLITYWPELDKTAEHSGVPIYPVRKGDTVTCEFPGLQMLRIVD